MKFKWLFYYGDLLFKKNNIIIIYSINYLFNYFYFYFYLIQLKHTIYIIVFYY